MVNIYDLLNQMTIEEKVGQLIQLSAPFYSNVDDITGPMNEMNMTDEKIYQVGSVLGLTGAKLVKEVQKNYLEKSRLKIPLIFMADIIHGDTTIFPIPLGIGATWNPILAKRMAEISAREASVQGLHVTFSPMVDLVRDPRWGRVMESTGEDKFLNSKFAKALVSGYQGENILESKEHLAACVKHFAGYGAPRGGRDYNSVDLSENTLRDQYLPAYYAAIEAGAKLVMASFNTLDNMPASGNKKLMRNILRNEMHFEGVLISDWGSIGELVSHRVATDLKEAAELAIDAGIDIEMMSAAYSKYLVSLAKQDKLILEKLDEAVLRVLKLKEDLNLFENPYRGADEERESNILYSKEHLDEARRIAEESFVLLKNKDSVLPINNLNNVALTGPFKDNRNILGAWSWLGHKHSPKTMQEELSEVVTFEENLIFEGQASFRLSFLDNIETLIVAVGEDVEMSGEAASRVDITLPKQQICLIKELYKLRKKIVLVIFNGRPLDLSEIEPFVDAILISWFPGSAGAAAIKNVLTGKTNPSGKLTMTFPRSVGQIPIFYNEDSTGRPFSVSKEKGKYFSRYLDCHNSPLYEFGYGLSYSQFKFNEIKLSKFEIWNNDELEISVDITNISEVDGWEVVQLYIQDSVAKLARPIKELKGFKKVFISSGTTETVKFIITEEDLRYPHFDNIFTSDPGEFLVGVGNSSSVEFSKSFILRK
ncbi:glycoside hydrolase family 3 C-terminal domain-containing protein [Aerococcaceae bacterium zg-BR22]|uniref:glycoside hydrolase family 3 N-terminal domain-containing protein n=1 Tax=Aerococcaceae bacterium zg-1292 TaxID=2774330 RepID=UPI0040649049|nr:glycoside hydrolase family 3 C-terminal domain-containing protein [Aerococcaceae bacterium zg-BR22]